MGYELDDFQKWCIDGILSEDAVHRLCAEVALLLVSRQNGKNVILEVVELYAFYILDWPVIYHTAHLAETSAQHMQRLRAVIEANPDLDAITDIIEANGKEKIRRRDTKAMIRFVTRSKKIGRGPSPRAVVFDEALYLTDEQMQATLPAMSAQSMNVDMPLLIFTSSAPVPESLVLHRVRDQFINGQLDGFFADWGVEYSKDLDVRNRDLWYQANPSLGVRISEAWVAEKELALLKPESFAIERLGVVYPHEAASTELPTWGDCLDGDSRRSGPVLGIAVDVATDLTWTSIAVAARRDDGLLHVELVETLPGTSAAALVLKAMTTLHPVPVLLNPRSEAGGLVQPLIDAGVEVEEIGPLDYLKACVQFRQAVANRLLRHRDQGPLNTAVAGAGIRTAGDGWVWAPRNSTVDISPLIAVTLAAWQAGEPVEEEEQEVTLW